MRPPEGPDIVLEFSGGVMTIRTQEAVYQVSVTALGEGARTLPPRAQQALPGLERPAREARRKLPSGEASPALAPPAADYYSELCHDTYREVGLLARRLATSLDKPGSRDAKAQAGKELAQEMERSLEKSHKLLAELKRPPMSSAKTPRTGASCWRRWKNPPPTGKTPWPPWPSGPRS